MKKLSLLTFWKRWYKIWMAFSAILYIVGGFLFLLASRFVFDVFNFLAKIISIGKPIPYPAEKFWLVLAFGYMVGVAWASYLAMEDIRRTKCRNFTLVVVLEKTVSTLAFLLMFIFSPGDKRYFAYLVGVALDGSLAIITILFYLKAVSYFEESLPVNIAKDEPFHPEGRTTFELFAIEGRLETDEEEDIFFTQRFVSLRSDKLWRLPTLAKQMVISDPGGVSKRKYHACQAPLPIPHFFPG